MARMDDDIRELAALGRNLTALCEQPETGLLSWHGMLCGVLDRIAAHSGGYLVERNMIETGSHYPASGPGGAS